MPKKVIEIIKNENFALYTFIILITIPLVVILIHLIEISEIILNNILTIVETKLAAVDLGFICQILFIIVGMVAIVTVTRYYLYIWSVDYLLIAFFIFGTVAWQIWVVYCEFVDPTLMMVGAGPTGLNKGIHLGFLVRHLTRQPYLWGNIVLLFQCVRMRSWKDYHLIMKIVIIILFIDLIIWTIGDFILIQYVFEVDTIEIWISRMTEAFNAVFSLFTLIKQILFPGMYWGAIYIIIVYIFVIYTYITMKPEYQTRSIKISRVIWIIFALLGVIIWYLDYLVFLGGYVPELESQWQVYLTLFTFLQLILLFIIQVFIPESLLITDYQILRARKIYDMIKSKPIPVIMKLDRVQDYLRQVLEIISSAD